LIRDGVVTAAELAARCPWPKQRVEYFERLGTFDWSQFDSVQSENAGEATPAKFRCPVCAHEWTGRPKPELVVQ
jgi:hypothetical protein